MLSCAVSVVAFHVDGSAFLTRLSSHEWLYSWQEFTTNYTCIDAFIEKDYELALHIWDKQSCAEL
jgi:hypothetical protein